mgnify:CR=1 FL=1
MDKISKLSIQIAEAVKDGNDFFNKANLLAEERDKAISETILNEKLLEGTVWKFKQNPYNQIASQFDIYLNLDSLSKAHENLLIQLLSCHIGIAFPIDRGIGLLPFYKQNKLLTGTKIVSTKGFDKPKIYFPIKIITKKILCKIK